MGMKVMLRHPDFLNALVTFDGKNVSAAQADYICQTLQQIAPARMGSSLARVNLAAYIMLRWVLSWLPYLAPRSSLAWIRRAQATERIVKCRVGHGSFVHACIHTDSSTQHSCI